MYRITSVIVLITFTSEELENKRKLNCHLTAKLNLKTRFSETISCLKELKDKLVTFYMFNLFNGGHHVVFIK